jgi:hypothetical protein
MLSGKSSKNMLLFLMTTQSYKSTSAYFECE